MSRSAFKFLALTSLVSGAVYYSTNCPTVEFIDSGELAMACKYLGIAHPTGYPLYTLLGRLAAVLPGGDLIGRLNFLSLTLTALASGFLYLLIHEVIRRGNESVFSHLTAVAAALFVAFSPIWWAQGTTNEVYSLNLLLISISTWSLLRFTNVDEHPLPWLLLSLYSLGLCFANHLSAVYLVPGILALIIPRLRAVRANLRDIGLATMALLFPLTLYLTLPIRAHFKPFLNWGGVSDPYFLFKHISGWQYRVWMFEKPLEIFRDFSAKITPAWELLRSQFAPYGISLLVIGIVLGVFYYRKLLVFALLVWIVNLVYVLNYDIGDIETYYLPMILVCSIFIAAAMQFIIGRVSIFRRGNAVVATIIIVLLTLFPALNLLRNYRGADRSRKTFARQGVLDLAGSMTDGGVALVENWDFYSPWLYLHYEEHFRPDIVLLDKELMRRSWYIDFIKRYHPEIYSRSKPQFEEFLKQVHGFERNRPYDPDVIDQAYYGMLRAVISNESRRGAVYTNVFTDKRLLRDEYLAPDGILFCFQKSREFLERPRYIFPQEYWEKASATPDKRVAYLLSFYARAFDSRHKYCQYFNRPEEAKYYLTLNRNVGELIAALTR